MSHPLELALLSCALLGLRHGFDYDHLAAITDITGIQRNWREGMRLGLLYALGHALTVAALGVSVIALHLTIPPGLDAIGERLVGATLIVLAIYVAVSWVRHRRTQARHNQARYRQAGHPHAGHLDLAGTLPPPRSRIALLVSGTRYVIWRARRLRNPNLPRPASFRFDYSNSSVFFVGILHGLGAETPSQLLLFLLAAQLGGTTRGLLGLLCFVGGLLVMNTFMTASAGGVFASSRNLPRLQTIATSLAVAYSFIIGTIFLFGISDKLPALAH